MELIHKLGNTVIQEPIGFDNLEVKLERGDYHGISAEVSMGSLEFYGNAYGIVKAAYDADIDTAVVYQVTADGVTVYEGTLDLSTCTFSDGDYRSVSCKVGEIGAKTTFNNRVETDVDLNTQKTIDGAVLAHIPTWKTISLPQKHIAYTNLLRERVGNVSSSMNLIKHVTSAPDEYVQFMFSDIKAAEWAEITQHEYVVDDPSDLINIFDLTDDFEEKYGTGTRMEVTGRIQAKFSFANSPVWSTLQLYISAGVMGSDGWIAQSSEQYFPVNAGATQLQTDWFEFTGSAAADSKVSICFKLRATSFSDTSFTVQPGIGSEVKFVMYDTLEYQDVDVPMLPVFEATNVISEAISENQIAVVSDWLSRPDAAFNASTTFGGGALKFLTNGYKIRGLFTDAENERNMPLSFKTMIEALSAMDCIGWGFDGNNVRVERWSWFYKDSVVLTIVGANSVKREPDTSRIITELQIGYKKYETTSEYNSIDSIHGSRTFKSKIKAVSKNMSKLCEFIADNYAIELARRSALDLDASEEFKYDENIFVLEMQIRNNVYGVAKSASVTGMEGIGRPSELINARLSPRHCAARWADLLFTANKSEDMVFSTGEINYNAGFALNQQRAWLKYLESFAGDDKQMENAPITYQHSKLKAEKITFEYPISLDQYKAVKANPYGLISVNGVKGWITSFSYNFSEGMAKFTLIAKNE